MSRMGSEGEREGRDDGLAWVEQAEKMGRVRREKNGLNGFSPRA